MSSINTMQFGIRIGATDDTAAARRSLLSNWSRLAIKPITIPLQIARGGLGLLRDIQMGLRPTVQMIDRFLDKGAGLEGIQRAFQKSSGLTGNRAEYAARSLQAAAMGTIRWGEAMRLANKGMSDDFSLKQMETIFRFARTKASAEGSAGMEDIAGSLMQGLMMGSGRVLKQFGLDLGDVEERYAKIKGVGAFDDLPFAERRMIIMAAALEKMTKESQRLRVPWNDTGIMWQTIKTQIGDSVDRLTLMAVKSKVVRDELSWMRDGLAGITRHFQQGGGLGELFFGKGKSGGLFGLLKAGLMDAGEWLGKGILRGVIGAVLDIHKLLTNILPGVGAALGGAALGGAASALEKRLVPQDIIDQVRGVEGTNSGTKPGVRGVAVKSLARGMAESDIGLAEVLKTIGDYGIMNFLGMGSLGQPGGTAPARRRTTIGDAPPIPFSSALLNSLSVTEKSIERGFLRAWRILTGGVVPPPLKAVSMGGGVPMNPMLAMMQGVGTAALGGFLPDWMTGGHIIDALQRYKGQLAENPGGGRWAAEMRNWQAEFPGGAPSDVRRAGMRIDPSKYRFAVTERLHRQRVLANQRARLRNIERGGEFAGQDANRAAGAEVAALRREGRYLSGSDIREIYARHRREAIDERAGPMDPATGKRIGPLQQQIDKGVDELRHSDSRQARQIREGFGRRRANEWADNENGWSGARGDEGFYTAVRATTNRRRKEVREEIKAAQDAERTAKNTGDTNDKLDAILAAMGGIATGLGVQAAGLPNGK